MTDGSDAGDGVGEELAKAREALGFSVADVAQQLKFAARQIDALERGRYAELPTGTFARGMVRAYARLLKLDPEPLVKRIAERVATPHNAAVAASVTRPIPITDSARRTNVIYAVLSVAILVVIVGVVFEWQREDSGSAPLTFVPAAAPVPQATTAPAQQVASSSASVGAMSVSPGATATIDPAQGGAAPAAAAPPPALAASAAPAEGLRRLSLKFDRESWVEIRGRGGKLLTQQLNPGGSEQTVEGKPPFTLIIGNAQYVRLSYEERPVDLTPYVKVEVARFTLD